MKNPIFLFLGAFFFFTIQVFANHESCHIGDSFSEQIITDNREIPWSPILENKDEKVDYEIPWPVIIGVKNKVFTATSGGIASAPIIRDQTNTITEFKLAPKDLEGAWKIGSQDDPKTFNIEILPNSRMMRVSELDPENPETILRSGENPLERNEQEEWVYVPQEIYESISDKNAHYLFMSSYPNNEEQMYGNPDDYILRFVGLNYNGEQFLGVSMISPLNSREQNSDVVCTFENVTPYENDLNFSEENASYILEWGFPENAHFLGAKVQ